MQVGRDYNDRSNEKDARYEPQYPPTVELIGTHPVVYSANGSHGLWGSPGLAKCQLTTTSRSKTVYL